MHDAEQDIPVPATAQASLRSMMVQLRQMEAQVNAYVHGLQDILGLDGGGWILNLESMAFVKQSREETVNGVGAASGDTEGK